MTIEQGQSRIDALLRAEANSQNVGVDRTWWSSAGETEPSRYSLEACNDAGWHEERDFKPEHLTDLDSDNEMKMQVHQKIVGMVSKLKKHERQPNQ